jgi:hypothetical protein
VWRHRPPSAVADERGLVCVDVDATLVTAHSDKQDAAGTFKGGFGFHPLVGYLDRQDGTGEALAGVLRPGNAGSVRHEVARVEWTHRREVRLMSKV